MSLLSLPGRLKDRVYSSLYRRAVALKSPFPVVSFTFDDFPRSACTAGSKILEACGVRGTFYVATGLMNEENALGELFRAEDLGALVEHGHEVAIHGHRHVSARRVPAHEFLGDVELCQSELGTLIPGGASRNFAYPYGEATLSCKRELGPRMESSRGTIHGFNGPEVDLNLLRANPLYGDESRIESARRLIQENEERRSWLIFYSHDVRANPSRYGCTPALLRELISFAANRRNTILPVGEVLRQFCL